jgi:dipeptidyl aminopeptidase/acylaminoacyl peptidase
MMMKLLFATSAAALCTGTAFAQASAPAAAPAAASDAAAKFGAREGVEDISLSPDGKNIAFIVPVAGKLANALYTAPVDQSTPPKQILAGTGNPESLGGCGWVSNTRLLCQVVIHRITDDVPEVLTRMVAIDSAGGNVKMVSRRDGANALYQSSFGGMVLDWLPGENGSVLVGRAYTPEEKIGSLVNSRLEGYGVDRVDTRTLDAKRVEDPKPDAMEYISDGKGRIRIMGTRGRTPTGYAGSTIKYFYRRADSDKWLHLSDYDVVSGRGFNPVAVDSARDVVYGFDQSGDLTGLYEVGLALPVAPKPVFTHRQVDVDSTVRLGRSQRVVGVTYAVEKREAVYFDPELKALAASLGKALPKTPLIRFDGASEDETKLLVWAGSDLDPGHYYLLDRKTKKMQRLIAARPELDGLPLAPVKPIQYRAADGTMIPGYLTLPPGSSGKGLPAIVMPHGGPAARDEWGFDWLAQYYANRGYAVLQPNFRGSSGYGSEWFKDNGFQSWRIAIGDVADAGRWLVEQKISDPAKLAVVGWSYGGYAALQSAVVAPDLFKAVVAIAPVTDLQQLRVDGMRYMSGAVMRDYLGSGPHLREGSPAQNAGAIKAPVLMFHGTIDGNVPIRQARLMKDKLDGAGKKAQLVVYPGLEHSLRDSAARTDMLRQSDAFLRTALGL